MLRQLRNAALATAFITTAPFIPMLSGDGAAAHAGTYGSGQIVVSSPSFVLGFSFGNPYAVGPVCDSPEYCDAGPVYYYPAYRVYGQYSPRYQYTYYQRPVACERRYDGGGRYGYGHGYGHGYGGGYGYGNGYRREHGNGNGYGDGRGYNRDGRREHGNGNGDGRGQRGHDGGIRGHHD